MSRRRRHRTLIWTAVGVQVAGLIVDVLWHALHSDFEAKTVEQMVVHLGTIHIPIYVGVLCVLLTTAWALIDQARRPPVGAAFPVAFVGGLVSTAGGGRPTPSPPPTITPPPPTTGRGGGGALGGWVMGGGGRGVGGRHDRRRKPADVDQRRAA